MLHGKWMAAWGVALIAALSPSTKTAQAQWQDGAYRTRVVDGSDVTIHTSGWRIRFWGTPPSCHESREVLSEWDLSHAFGIDDLQAYGGYSIPALCATAGQLRIHAPSTYVATGMTTYRTASPDGRFAMGWDEPHVISTSTISASGCQPELREETTESRRQLFRFDTMQMTNDGIEYVKRRFLGDREVGVDIYSTRVEPRLWRAMELDFLGFVVCDAGQLSAADPHVPGKVAGVVAGFENLDLSWVTPQLAPQPTLTVTRSDASTDIGTFVYLGTEGATSGYRHRWRYNAPAHTGSTSSPKLTFTASQSGVPASRLDLALHVPPVVLVHGLWSDAGALLHMEEFLREHLPAIANVVPVDYRDTNAESFAHPATLAAIVSQAREAASGARVGGIATDSVNIVGHSMGGLAGALYEDVRQAGDPRIARLVTIGTPMRGSALAPWMLSLDIDRSPTCTQLATQSNATRWLPIAMAECGTESLLTLFNPYEYLARRGMRAGPALAALTPGSADLARADAALARRPLYAIAGDASFSTAEAMLNVLSFMSGSGDTLDALLGTSHDSIVSVASQTARGESVVFSDHIHTTLLFGRTDITGNTEEMESDDVTSRVVCVLAGTTCPPVPQRASRVAVTGANDIYTAIFAQRTRITPTFTTVASLPTFRQFSPATITLRSPSGCALERAWWWPARQPFGYANAAPFQVTFTPRTTGPSRASVVGLCGGDRYFAVSSDIAINTAVAPLRFVTDHVELEAGARVRVPLIAGTDAMFDAYGTAVLTSTEPTVTNVDPVNGKIRALKPGFATLHAAMGTSSADLSVIVVAPLERIFENDFDPLADGE